MFKKFAYELIFFALKKDCCKYLSLSGYLSDRVKSILGQYAMSGFSRAMKIITLGKTDKNKFEMFQTIISSINLIPPVFKLAYVHCTLVQHTKLMSRYKHDISICLLEYILPKRVF